MIVWGNRISEVPLFEQEIARECRLSESAPYLQGSPLSPILSVPYLHGSPLSPILTVPYLHDLYPLFFQSPVCKVAPYPLFLQCPICKVALYPLFFQSVPYLQKWGTYAMASIQSLSNASAAKPFGEMCGKSSTHGTSHATLSEMSRCRIWSLYPRFYQEAWAQRMLEQGHQEECGEQLGTKDCRLGQVHCLRPLGLAQFLFMEMSQSCNAQPSVHCAGCWRWVYRCTEDIVVWYIEGGLWKAGFWPRGLRQIWELHSMLGMLLSGG